MKLRRKSFLACVCCIVSTLLAWGCAVEEKQQPERLKMGALFDGEDVYAQDPPTSSGVYCADNPSDSFSRSTTDCPTMSDGTSPLLHHLYFRQETPTIAENIRRFLPEDYIDAWLTFEIGSSYDTVGYRPHTVPFRIYGAHLSTDGIGGEARIPAQYICAYVLDISRRAAESVSFHALSLPTDTRPRVVFLQPTWVTCYANAPLPVSPI